MFRTTSLVLACVFAAACSQSDSVVLYASVDRQLAEPLVGAFEESTGLDVRAVFDVEANKTAGLINRLAAERTAPRADVFWSGEVGRTIELCERGILQPLVHPALEKLRGAKDDPHGCWFVLAARLRVLLVHESEATSASGHLSISELTSARWHGRACIANPRFGTTATHFAALLTKWGEVRFRQWLRDLRANAVAVLPGNAQVKESVSRGACSLGLTDTDDALAALTVSAPVRLVIPDQESEMSPDQQQQGAAGVVMIPSTVAAVAGGRNTTAGRRFIQFLLSGESEGRLVSGPGGFIPIRYSELDGPAGLPALGELAVMRVDYAAVAKAMPSMLRIVDEEWPR